MSLSINIGRPFLNDKTLDEQARSVLRLYGTNAHVYLPGANGVAVSGLPTNNYTLSDGSTGYSAVDGTAGLVLDAAGVSSQTVPLIDTFTFTAAGSTPPTASSSDTFLGSACVSVTMPANTGGYSVCRADGSGGAARHTITAGRFIQYTYTVALSRLLTGGERVKIYSTGQNGSSELFLLTSASPENTWIDGASSMVAGTTGDNYPAVMSDSVISAPVTVYLRQYSVKQVTGIHASQSTTANKPALRRGLYNLLTYSNDLSNAAWTKSGGSVSGVKFTPSAGSAAYKTVQHSTSAAATTPTTVFALVEPAGYSVASIVLTGTNGRGVVDLSTSTSTNYGGSGSFTVADAGSGRKIIAFAVTTGASAGSPWVGCQPTVSDPSVASTADGTSGINIYAIGIATGLYTAQQILAEGGIPLTTTAAASNPSAGRYWWDFPTAGKGLVLGSPVAQMTDDSWCVVCVNAVSNAADKYIANLGCGAVTQLVSSVCIKGTGFAQAAWVDDGAAHTKTIVDAVNHHGIPTVISAVKRGGVGYLRVNGVQIGSVDLTVMGATTVTAGMIGGFNAANTSNQFVGSMGQPNMGKGTISDADLLTLERWVASQTPNGPVF